MHPLAIQIFHNVGWGDKGNGLKEILRLDKCNHAKVCVPSST
jgi:hypothetical protein